MAEYRWVNRVLEKQCSICEKWKPLEGYYKTTKGGVWAGCKVCTGTQQAARIQSNDTKKREKAAQVEAWRERNPDKCKVYKRTSDLRRAYGLSREEYESLLQAQNNTCAICGHAFKSSKHTHVDHDHSTGAVRAILCLNCNRGLGAFSDNPLLLQKAHEYLVEHSSHEGGVGSA